MSNVSATCETWREGTREPCGYEAKFAYPAMGGGYHAMCPFHAKKHMDYCVTIDQARQGVTPKPFQQRTSPA